VIAAGWGVAVWVALRLFGVLAVQPHWRRVLGGWWWPVSAVLALALVPAVAPAIVGDAVVARTTTDWIALGLLELLLGAVIGGLVGLPGYALIGALDGSGRALGLHAGGSRVMTGLGLALVLGGALALDLHRPLLVGLVSTFDAWALAQPAAWIELSTDGLARTVVAARGMLVLALALATPVLLTVAVVDLGLRLLGRGPTPAEPITEAVRPWLRTAAALVALGASWSTFPDAWARGLG
jgi:type III secretory pathway component EscT